MDQSTAQHLGPLVHNRKHYTALQGYAEARIQVLYQQLSTAVEIDEVRKLQGQIKELKSLLSLKEAAEGAIKNASAEVRT